MDNLVHNLCYVFRIDMATDAALDVSSTGDSKRLHNWFIENRRGCASELKHFKWPAGMCVLEFSAPIRE